MSSGVTPDTGALIAFEAGKRSMAVLVEEAKAAGARLARLLRASNMAVVALDQRAALKVGARYAASGVADLVAASVVICARDHGHSMVTSDPDDLHAIDPKLRLFAP